MDSLSRSPVQEQTSSVKEKVEPPKETFTESSHTEQPPSVMETPYVSDLLEMGEAINHFEMKDKVDTIDSYIKSQITEDTRGAYKELFDNLVEKTNVRGTDLYNIVDKVYELVEINNKLIKLAREKEEMEKKPIQELTSKELREVINGSMG